ncbi:MAG: hypothetical protein WCC48_15850 [Anaeromyxobacteraceae bacterium]
MASIRTALPILMFAFACSSSGGGTDGASGPGGGSPPGGTPGPATVSEYCDQYWKAYATRWASCEHGSAAAAAAVYASAPRCADAVQAVAAGRASYEGSRSGGCLSFVETASCDILQAYMDGLYPQADCEASIAGKLGEGGTCYSNESCASGICFWSPSACPSFCATPTPSGAAFDPSFGICVAGTYPSGATGTCVPAVGLNGACTSLDLCAPGLFCEPGTSSVGACHARKTSGSCYDNSECAIGYRCSGSACVPWLRAGDSCTQGQNACGPGLWCGAGGTCIDGAAPGWSCATVNGERVPCVGGTCTARVGGNVCTAWLAPGGTCSLQSQCAPTDACVYGTGQCTTLCAEP